jgi:hypothetical protein
VGWLSKEHPFPTGDVPAAFIERLDVLVKYGIANDDTRAFPFLCELCGCARSKEEEIEMASFAEVRAVGADGAHFVAPMLILHYVTAHRYRPPQAFIDAVLRNASSRWEDAWALDLCLSCGSPMKRLEEPREVIRGDGVRGLLLYVACPTCAAQYPRFTPRP